MTLIDAYKIRDINLLVASYLFYSSHFVFILKVDEKRTQLSYDKLWVALGGIVGVIITGLLVDLVFKRKRFLLILILNAVVILLDFFRFASIHLKLEIGSQILGAIGGSVIYSSILIFWYLIPMTIAKQRSEDVAN